MNIRFHPGHCEDCHDNKGRLALCEYPLVPKGAGAELCAQCIATRNEECMRGEEPRMIGLTPTGDSSKWVDLPPLTLILREGNSVGEVAVKVRYRRPDGSDFSTKNGGEIKLLIGANDRWIWADFLDPETFGFHPHRAAVLAESALQKMMEERGSHMRAHHVQVETVLA